MHTEMLAGPPGRIMARLGASLLTFCLLVPRASAQTAERAAPAGNLLTRCLDRANIHPPVHLGRLSIFPISLSRTSRLDGVLTMDEALQRKLLAIQELDPPEVARARFVNRSAGQMIFLMAGEVLTGGRQNRTLATDALLGPKSSTVLPLYCVQKGRWRGGKSFAAETTVAPLAVRAKAARRAGQKEIWDEVARANRALGSATASEDLAAAMARPENVKRFAELRKRITPKLPDNCAGVAVADGGSIVGADLFNSAELFAAMRDKVLNSYLSQYAHGQPPARAARPGQTDVREYLRACYRARFAAGEMRGVGRIYHIRGARSGQTLGYGGPIIPVRDRKERSPLRAGQYMVHTALLPEIIPVRPVRPPRPRPVPRLGPPRLER